MGDGGADGRTNGGCKDVTSFSANAVGLLKQNCQGCHGGNNAQAKGAVDMSALNSDEAAACSQVKNRVSPANVGSSQLFITTDPGATPLTPSSSAATTGSSTPSSRASPSGLRPRSETLHENERQAPDASDATEPDARDPPRRGDTDARGVHQERPERSRRQRRSGGGSGGSGSVGAGVVDDAPRRPRKTPISSSLSPKNYSEALRTASLKLVRQLPTLAQIKSVAGAKDKKAAYEAELDKMLDDPASRSG